MLLYGPPLVPRKDRLSRLGDGVEQTGHFLEVSQLRRREREGLPIYQNALVIIKVQF